VDFGGRLKMARKAKKLTLEKLAEEIGVTAMSISKYENNKMNPDSTMLLKLANALDFNVEFFFRERGLELSPIKKRGHSRLSKKDEEMVEARVMDYVERYLEAKAYFPEDAKPANQKMSFKSIDDIERVAIEVRDQWEIGLDPIDSLVRTLEDRGIIIYFTESVNELDALTFDVNGTHVIAVNKDMPGDRQRFDIAHELGHIILEIPDSMEEKDEEKAAHRFAGAFLAPEPVVRMELGDHRSFVSIEEWYLLKHKYGLSIQAWIRRGRDLDIISHHVYQVLMAMFSANNWRRQEPGDPYPPEEPPKHFEMMLRRLYAEEAITFSRAQELYGEALEVFA
jgi:Zn-dependent peptidase ImmA (M78 family)/transcriptional regulator with XRE-family HTH domain